MKEDQKEDFNSKYFILGMLLLLGLFLALSLYKYFNAFLGSVIMYVICKPLVNSINTKWKWSNSLATTFILILSFLVVLLPLTGIVVMLTDKLSMIFADSDTLMHQIKLIKKLIYKLFRYNIMSDGNIDKFKIYASDLASRFIEQTLSTITDIGIMYLISFFMLANQKWLEEKIVEYLPFSTSNISILQKELNAQTYSNVIGAPLLALIQCIFAILGFWIFGLNDFLFWGIMCGVFSFIPFIGSAFIWLPAGIYQITSGQNWQGIGIILYGLIVIGNVDNLFRFIVNKKIADVHPLITIFGVLIGFEWFGLTGLIFGPLIISYFIILLRIYVKEYKLDK